MQANQPKGLISKSEIYSLLLPKLLQKGYKYLVLNSEKEVKDFINSAIPDQQQVGLGDSITSCKLNIRHLLAAKGSVIFYGWNGAENYNRSVDTFDILPKPKYYLTRINALSIDAEILLKDYSKGEAEANIFPEFVFAFAGLNRIVEKFNNSESLVKYPILHTAPEKVNFTIILLPFLTY